MNDHRAFSNIYIIAALLAYGFKALQVDRSNPRRQRFIFSKDERAEVYVVSDGSVSKVEADVNKLEALFISRTLMLPPGYADVLKDIRAAIHDCLNDYEYGV